MRANLRLKANWFNQGYSFSFFLYLQGTLVPADWMDENFFENFQVPNGICKLPHSPTKVKTIDGKKFAKQGSDQVLFESF